MIYDTLDNHLAAAGSFERAAIPGGMYFAWCANLGLLSAAFVQQHETLILRLRYREIRGSELFVVGAAGVLDSDMFNDAGRAFCERYYPQYLADFQAAFGADPHAVEDTWQNYDVIAPILTRHYLGPRVAADADKGRTADAGSGNAKHWWQVWR